MAKPLGRRSAEPSTMKVLGLQRLAYETGADAMSETAVPYQDNKVDVKVVLAGLWTSMLMVFAYVDIFGFFRADIIEGALAGEVPGPGFAINQAFLTATTVFVLIPILMIVASLTLRAPLNRKLNIGVSILYAVLVAASCVGETWIYYLLGSFVEVIFLLAIARIAWTWPKTANSVLPAGSN